MPFTKSLMETEGYEMHRYRCGIPSTTPFVQAGILPCSMEHLATAQSLLELEVLVCKQPERSADREATLGA